MNKYSEQDLIQNIENKIATCVDCRMILSDDAIESYEVTLRGRDKSGNPKVKTKLKCGYCGGGIKMRTEDRAHSIHYKTTTQGAMGSPDRPLSRCCRAQSAFWAFYSAGNVGPRRHG